MAASGASSTSALPVPAQSPSHAAAAAAGMTASTAPVGSTDSLPMYSTSTGDIAAASGSRGTSSAGDPSALRLSSYNPWTPQVRRVLVSPAQAPWDFAEHVTQSLLHNFMYCHHSRCWLAVPCLGSCCAHPGCC
jgi:hypothetical protein